MHHTLQEDREEVVKKHNELRALVANGLETRGVGSIAQPSAANMRKMEWDDELSTIAQT